MDAEFIDSLWGTVLVNVALTGIVILVLFFVLTVLWHVVLGIPYVPTPRKVVRAMLDLAELKPDSTVYDLGAGDARLLIAATKEQPAIRAVGFEASPTIWLLGKFRILLSRRKVQLRCANFYKHSFADADTIFLYLFPSAMQKLEEKFTKELKKGTTVISYTFKFPHKKPVLSTEVPSLRGHQSAYVYRW